MMPLCPRPTPVPRPIADGLAHHEERPTIPVCGPALDAALPSPTEDSHAWCLESADHALVALLLLVGAQ